MASLHGKGSLHSEPMMEPQHTFCDIRRRSTGFIDYDFYREAAKRERDRTKKSVCQEITWHIYRVVSERPRLVRVAKTQRTST